MAIITKGSNLEKGNEVEFTLNITDLLAHASVSGDAYFSDQSKWDKVFINYASEGYQKEILIFKNVDSGTTSTANFGVFSGARDTFEVQSIIIMDKQGGYLCIKRSDLVVADFDVAFSSLAEVLITNDNYSTAGSGSSVTSGFIVLQTFSYTEDFTVNKTSVGLKHFGSSTGSLKMQIVDPDGNVVLEDSTNTLDASTVPNTKTKYEFNFSGSASLSKNKIYYAVLTSAGDFNASNFFLVYRSSSNLNIYGGGVHSNDGIYPTNLGNVSPSDTSIDVTINAQTPSEVLKESEAQYISSYQYLTMNDSGSIGQTFTASSSYNLTHIALNWKSSNFATIQGTIKLELYDSVGGTLLGESEAQDANQTLNSTLKKMKFNSPVSITSGDSYYFKLVPVSGTNFDASNLRVTLTSSSGYVGGSCYQNDIEQSSLDLVFEIFGI